MKKIMLFALATLALTALPVLAQSTTGGTDADALRRALEQSLRENIALRADLEAARAEIDPLRGGADRPVAMSMPTAAPAPGRTHIVKEGETLGIISSRYYGTVMGYQRIFEANRTQIQNENLIYPGQRLVIP